MKVGVWNGGLGPHQPFHSGSSCHPGGPNFPAPMISAPIPGPCRRTKASSTPPVPPGWPTISRHHRVTNIHSCSLSPAWPNGASRLRPSPVPKPSSEMEKNWTRASDMGPPSVASGRGGGCGCILRAPVGPVDVERYALREGSRVDQVKRDVRAGVGEQPRALADYHGDDEQVDLVDELVLEQPPGQGAAAVHLQLTARPGFQLADGRRDGTGQDDRV